MARVETVQLTSKDLNSAEPRLRLRLIQKSTELGRKKGRKLPKNSAEKILVWMQSLVAKAEDEMSLESDPAMTEKNKEKLRSYFKKMRDHMDAQENEVLNEMDKMTPDQQEQLLEFWQGVQVFFTDVIDWIKKTFDFVLEKIKAGYKLVKDVVKGFFDQVLQLFKAVF